MGIRNRLDRLHGRIFPLEGIWVQRQNLESGGFPEELWGGVESIRRARRMHLELFLGTLLTLIGGLFLLKGTYGENWTILGTHIAIFSAVLLWMIWNVSLDTGQHIEKRALKQAKADPGALPIPWMRNYHLEKVITQHLETELTEAEHEVARTLIGDGWAYEYTGTARELCEIARELCRTELPA